MENEDQEMDVQPEVKPIITVDINPKRLADEAYSDYRTRRTQARKQIKQYLKGKMAYISTYFLPQYGKVTVNPPYRKADNNEQ